MFEKTTENFGNLLTWLFDKLGSLFIYIIGKSKKKDYSHLHKYRKLIGFTIVGIIF